MNCFLITNFLVCVHIIMFNTVLQKLKDSRWQPQELWKTDSDPKLTENFNDRPERNAENRIVMRMNAFQRPYAKRSTISEGNFWEKLKKLFQKCLLKDQARHRGDDDSSDSRGKTSHNTNVSVCVMDDPLENAGSVGSRKA